MLSKLRAFHNNPFRRPYWQIALLLPVFLLYFPASKFVEFMDESGL